MKKQQMLLRSLMPFLVMSSSAWGYEKKDAVYPGLVSLGFLAGVFAKDLYARHQRTQKCAREINRLESLLKKYESFEGWADENPDQVHNDLQQSRQIDTSCFDQQRKHLVAHLEQTLFDINNQVVHKQQQMALEDIAHKYQTICPKEQEIQADLQRLQLMPPTLLSQNSRDLRKNLIDQLRAQLGQIENDRHMRHVQQQKEQLIARMHSVQHAYQQELDGQVDTKRLMQKALEKYGGLTHAPFQAYQQGFIQDLHALSTLDRASLDEKQRVRLQQLLESMGKVEKAINSSLHEKIQEENYLNASRELDLKAKEAALVAKQTKARSIARSQEQLEAYLAKSTAAFDVAMHATQDHVIRTQQEFLKMLEHVKKVVNEHKAAARDVQSAVVLVEHKHSRILELLEKGVHSAKDTELITKELKSLQRDIAQIQQQISLIVLHYNQHQAGHNSEPSAPPMGY